MVKRMVKRMLKRMKKKEVKKADTMKGDKKGDKKDDNVTKRDDQKMIKSWISEFSIVYRDLVSRRYLEWKPGEKCYNNAAQFYASVGDVDTALQIFNENPVKVHDAPLVCIMLTLVFQNRIDEALQIANKIRETEDIRAGAGYVAAYLASNDKAKLKDYLQSLPDIEIKYCRTHFGIESRKKLLIETLTEIASEKTLNAKLQQLMEKILSPPQITLTVAT